MVSQFTKDKFDIGITRTDGTVTGLILAKDRNGVPIYSLVSKKKLADQYFTGIPDYGYQDPEEELPIQQDDWRAGIGLEIADSDDPKRYHKSTMDMRFRGMGICGTKPGTITAPTTYITSPLFLNMDMELTTGWSANNRSATNPKRDTYAWRLTASASNYQDTTSAFKTAWQSKTFLF